MSATVTEPFLVAAVEFNPELFEFDRNLDRAVAVAQEAAQHGAKLIVLPECALSGYIYRDLDQFRPYLDTVPGRGTDALAAVCAEHACHLAVGIAEIDRDTGLTYNTGALIGPQGYLGKYRKNGLNPSDVQWFTPGTTGYPVFDTELGRICLVICYDDTYMEPARLPAVKGADLIAYICASDRVLTELGPAAAGDHSTIAAVQQLVAYNGLAMVAADRNNVESNPTTGISVVYGGSASIWQATGERTGHLPATDANLTAANPGQVLYGRIDPARYDNPQKRTLQRRRPELYGDLAFDKGPTDVQASTVAHDVPVAALQYPIRPGGFDENVRQVDDLVNGLASDGFADGLVVLPAASFTGLPGDARTAVAWAETDVGRSVQVLSDLAVRLRSHVVGSHLERGAPDGPQGGRLLHTAVLLAPDGTVTGRYRQTHLDEGMDAWATAGDALTVLPTPIGRIGLLLGEDVRYPEAAAVLAVRRADLIAVPSAWTGDFGGPLCESAGLFAHPFPAGTMVLWYATAKTTQAFTVVANPVGGGAQGSSGVFTVNPVDGDPPVVGSTDGTEVVRATVRTMGDPDAWIDQRRLLAGRRADLAVPLVLPTDSPAFRTWRDNAGWDASGWTAYRP